MDWVRVRELPYGEYVGGVTGDEVRGGAKGSVVGNDDVHFVREGGATAHGGPVDVRGLHEMPHSVWWRISTERG